MLEDNNRPPLSHAEYSALRQLFGMVSGWEGQKDALRKRLELIPGGWEKAEQITRDCEKLLQEVLDTIPARKLQVIQKELKSTKCMIVVRDTIADNETFCYCETHALERITQKAVDVECFACEKRGRDARNCKLRKDIEALFMWDFPRVKDGEACHFADKVIKRE